MLTAAAIAAHAVDHLNVTTVCGVLDKIDTEDKVDKFAVGLITFWGGNRVGEGFCKTVLQLLSHDEKRYESKKHRRGDDSSDTNNYQKVFDVLMVKSQENSVLVSDNEHLCKGAHRLDLAIGTLEKKLEDCQLNVKSLENELESIDENAHQRIPVHVPAPAPAPAPAHAAPAASSAAGAGPDFANMVLPPVKGYWDLRKDWVIYWVDRNLQGNVLKAAKKALEKSTDIVKKPNDFLNKIKDEPLSLRVGDFQF